VVDDGLSREEGAKGIEKLGVEGLERSCEKPLAGVPRFRESTGTADLVTGTKRSSRDSAVTTGASLDPPEWGLII